MGFFLGALIGGGATLLFAPYSGEKLRTDLPVLFQQKVEEVRKAGTQKREELEKQLASLRSPKTEQ
jgi:gas vesicle protein